MENNDANEQHEPEKNTKTTGSFLNKLKQKAKENNRNYLTEGYVPQDGSVEAKACPNCGAGRPKNSNVRFCSYCGFEFLKNDHTDGVYLKDKP